MTLCLTSLPPEILEHVAQQTRDEDRQETFENLRSLSLVSKVFVEPCQRELFHSLIFGARRFSEFVSDGNCPAAYAPAITIDLVNQSRTSYGGAGSDLAGQDLALHIPTPTIRLATLLERFPLHALRYIKEVQVDETHDYVLPGSAPSKASTQGLEEYESMSVFVASRELVYEFLCSCLPSLQKLILHTKRMTVFPLPTPFVDRYPHPTTSFPRLLASAAVSPFRNVTHLNLVIRYPIDLAFLSGKNFPSLFHLEVPEAWFERVNTSRWLQAHDSSSDGIGRQDQPRPVIKNFLFYSYHPRRPRWHDNGDEYRWLAHVDCPLDFSRLEVLHLRIHSVAVHEVIGQFIKVTARESSVHTLRLLLDDRFIDSLMGTVDISPLNLCVANHDNLRHFLLSIRLSRVPHVRPFFEDWFVTLFRSLEQSNLEHISITLLFPFKQHLYTEIKDVLGNTFDTSLSRLGAAPSGHPSSKRFPKVKKAELNIIVNGLPYHPIPVTEADILVDLWKLFPRLAGEKHFEVDVRVERDLEEDYDRSWVFPL